MEDSTTISAVIGGVIWYLGHRLWNYIGTSKQNKVQELTNIIADVLQTAISTLESDVPLDRLRIKLRGLSAVQIARAGYNADNPPMPIAIARDLAIEAAVRLYIRLHPSPKNSAAGSAWLTEHGIGPS